MSDKEMTYTDHKFEKVYDMWIGEDYKTKVDIVKDMNDDLTEVLFKTLCKKNHPELAELVITIR